MVFIQMTTFNIIGESDMNGTARFEKGKQLLEYQNYLLVETSGGQKSNLYLNALHFFNTRVNLTPIAA
jgi:hypothetical protein